MSRAAVVLPVLNEERDIDEVLTRVRAQTVDDIEILVVDGGSTDGTSEVVSRHAREDRRVRLLRNPRRMQSAGLNVALNETQAPVLARLDGHSFIEDDYIARCLRLLDETGADVVGGQMVGMGSTTTVERAIELTNGRWWGAGPARFHGSRVAGEVDTVYLGCFRRETLIRARGWAEDVGVNEDYELNARIRQAGGHVWFDPSLLVGYRPRSTLLALAKQYFRYGRSKATMLRRHPSSIRLRQAMPAALGGTLVLSLVPWSGRPLARTLLGAHVAVVAAASLREPEPMRVRAGAIAAAVVMHWCWSAGFWFGSIWTFPTASEGGG